MPAHSLIQKKTEFIDIIISKLFDIQHNQLSSRVERWMYEMSDGNIGSILQQQLIISKIAPCERKSNSQLPKEIKNLMKGLIKGQNKNNECFRWCLVRYLNPVNKNAAKIRNVDKRFTI